VVPIEATPESVARTYANMESRVAVLRRNLQKPLTLSDKLLLGHLDNPHSQTDLQPGRSFLQLRPDRVVLQDVLGQTALLQFLQTGRARVAVPATIHCDHLIQARAEAESDLREAIEDNTEVYRFLRSAAARFGLGFWGPGAGIIHQVVLEHYAFPGALIVGTDSHTPNAGGLGSFAVGVGGAEAVEVLADLPWELLYPERIGVHLIGELRGWTAPKDVILHLAGRLTVSGATNAILEYFGPGAHTISATGKATITNMGAELGATTSVFGYDARMGAYLCATGRAELASLAERHAALLAPDPEVITHPTEYYDRVLEVDLSRLEPYVVGPFSPDRARPISDLKKEVQDPSNGFVDDISTALIGSCTNSSYQDMTRVADVAAQGSQHGLQAAVPLLVTPGSEQIRATVERDGQLTALERIGATVFASACGPCIGQWHRPAVAAQSANTIVTSFNRNFPRRNDGAPNTMNFLASPEVVTAFALAGRLSFNPLVDTLANAAGQPFVLEPPRAAPDIPANGFESGRPFYVAPPADGGDVRIEVDPASERLQALQPWPAWDGHDLTDLPVLIKTRGKTTTDHISPAGAWLRYRGHLEKFSRNMFMGAANAFSTAPGVGTNVVTGETQQAIALIASDYRERGLKWVVIGDANYGEGSSREHAALSPRFLGGVVVIARGFARIHEMNLKKQGLLALTFQDAADYDRVRVDDRLSLLGLARLSPGRAVECRVAHADGSTETVWLAHSYTESQLNWFRAGSALASMGHGLSAD
jgi:aconitate hydratase A / 2-methylisocitrate dehydratase